MRRRRDAHAARRADPQQPAGVPFTAHLALTASGTQYLYERDFATVALSITEDALHHAAPGKGQDVELQPDFTGLRIFGAHVPVRSTAGPDTPVARGEIGRWTDQTRVSVTSTGPDGCPLYFDYDATTKQTSTNLITALTDLGQQ